MITQCQKRVQSLNLQGLPAFLSLIHREDKKMQPRIENLCYLCAGIALFFALNQHFIGHGMAYTCHAIQSQRNNFVYEIGILFFTALVFFGGYFLYKTAPIFSAIAALVAVFGLGFLQNKAQLNDFNFAQAKVEKVWGAK